MTEEYEIECDIADECSVLEELQRNKITADKNLFSHFKKYCCSTEKFPDCSERKKYIAQRRCI